MPSSSEPGSERSVGGPHGYTATHGSVREGRGDGAASPQYSLEEVLLAVDAAGAGEAALGQLHLAVGAL